jgi:hypothetical protein
MRYFSLLSMFVLLAFSPVAAFAGVASQIPAVAKNMAIAPHKALYDIKLAGLKSGSQIVNISGQMLYEWQPTCEGWLANHRFNLLYEYADNQPMRITSDFSTFESFDGKSLDFTSQRKRDGQLFEEFRGRAVYDENGKGEAVYSLPNGLEFQLTPGSMFPMQHTANILKSISEGKKFFHARVFDGADEEGPVDINAFIGKKIDPVSVKSAGKEINAELLASPAHNLRLAFFPVNSDAPTADYEMDMNLHENGVVSDMLIEYDDFSVSQKLRALEPLKNACAHKDAKQ